MALSCASRECNSSWVEDPAHILVFTSRCIIFKGNIVSDLCCFFVFEWFLNHRCRVLFDFLGDIGITVIVKHFYWKLPKFEFVAANVYEFVLKHFLYKFGVF